MSDHPIDKFTAPVRLKDLKLLDLNARYMKHETFQTLVRNIRRDGGLLGNTPFAARIPDVEGVTHLRDGTVLPCRYLVLSGNHRVQAAIEAGIEYEDVTITDDDLPEQRRTAIQLSQNAITGEDDPAILKQLYERMDSVDWRDYSGLDDKTLDMLEEVKPGSLAEANLDFQSITIAFLPDEAEEIGKAWGAVRELVGSKPDEMWVALLREYDDLMDAIDLASKSYGVKNVAVALKVVLAVFRAHRTDLASGFLEDWDEPKAGKENAWVPLETLLGTTEVPAPAAAIIRKALKQMRRADDVSEKALWQALELWAADYLASASQPTHNG